MFLKRSTYSSIGLDIGKSSVKMVQLVMDNGGFKVQGFLSKPVSLNDKEDSKEKIIESIKMAYRDGSFKGNNVVTFLPSSEIDLRQITVQSEKHEEIIKAIGFEADSCLPYKAKDAVLDYIEIGDILTNGEKKKKILVVAAQRKKIDEILEITKAADLKCIAIDILPMAQLRAVREIDYVKKEATFSVIDIGYDKSTVSIFNEGKLLFSKSIHVGGNTLTKTIINELSTDEPAAERYKARYGIDEKEGNPRGFEIDEKMALDEKVPSLLLEILKEDLEEMLYEIEKMFNFCSAELRGIKPKKMIILGGGSMLKNLSNYLAGKLEIDVKFWELSSAFSVEDRNNYSEEKNILCPVFATALGLAMRG